MPCNFASPPLLARRLHEEPLIREKDCCKTHENVEEGRRSSRRVHSSCTSSLIEERVPNVQLLLIFGSLLLLLLSLCNQRVVVYLRNVYRISLSHPPPSLQLVRKCSPPHPPESLSFISFYPSLFFFVCVETGFLLHKIPRASVIPKRCACAMRILFTGLRRWQCNFLGCCGREQGLQCRLPAPTDIANDVQGIKRRFFSSSPPLIFFSSLCGRRWRGRERSGGISTRDRMFVLECQIPFPSPPPSAET